MLYVAGKGDISMPHSDVVFHEAIVGELSIVGHNGKSQSYMTTLSYKDIIATCIEGRVMM